MMRAGWAFAARRNFATRFICFLPFAVSGRSSSGPAQSGQSAWPCRRKNTFIARISVADSISQVHIRSPPCRFGAIPPSSPLPLEIFHELPHQSRRKDWPESLQSDAPPGEVRDRGQSRPPRARRIARARDAQAFKKSARRAHLARTSRRPKRVRENGPQAEESRQSSFRNARRGSALPDRAAVDRYLRSGERSCGRRHRHLSQLRARERLCRICRLGNGGRDQIAQSRTTAGDVAGEEIESAPAAQHFAEILS